MSNQSDDLCCGGTRLRRGCEYHDPALQPAAPELLFPIEPIDVAIERLRQISGESKGLRLLGPDDPEVSSDDIYLDERTGGVVAKPSDRAQAMPSVTICVFGEFYTVYPESELSTGSDLAELFAKQIPGATFENGQCVVRWTEPADAWAPIVGDGGRCRYCLYYGRTCAFHGGGRA